MAVFITGAGIAPNLSGLPSGYTQLEYIESTGTQYIDTGIIPTDETKIEVYFQLTNISSNRVIFGVVGQFSLRWVSANEYFRVVTGSQANFPTSIDGLGEHKAIITKTTSNIDGTQKTQNTNTVTNPIFISAYNNGSAATIYAMCKYWYFKHYEGENLMHEFIPCKNSSNEIGLYDVVSQSFFANSGTGVFVAGPEL